MGAFVIKYKNQRDEFTGKEIELQIPIPCVDEIDKGRKLIKKLTKKEEEPKKNIFGIPVKKKKKKKCQEGVIRKIPALLASLVLIATDESK